MATDSRAMSEPALPDSVLSQARSEAASYLQEANKLVGTKLIAVAAILGLGAATTTPLVLLLLPFAVYAFDAMQDSILKHCAWTVEVTAASVERNGSEEAKLALEAWPLRTRASMEELSSPHLLLRSLVQVVALIGSGLGCAAFVLSVTPLTYRWGEPIGIMWLVCASAWGWRRPIRYHAMVYWVPIAAFVVAWVVLLWMHQRIPFVERLTWS